MDSNLTLAHLTHKTVIILLHQAIAYPPHHWKSSPVKLPSSSSAETCIEAASDISAIGQQFLLCSSMLTNPQFSFCLFIAGRMLLTHARYNASPTPPALDTLIASLLTISARWAGPRDIHGPEKENLATVFAKRLVQARDNLPPTAAARGSLDIRQPVYSETEDRLPGPNTRPNTAFGNGHTPSLAPSNPSASAAPAPAGPTLPLEMDDNPFPDFQDTTSDTSLTLAFPPLPLSFQSGFAPYTDEHSDPFNLHPGLDPTVSNSDGQQGEEQRQDAARSWNFINPFYTQEDSSVSVSEDGNGNGPSPGQIH